MYFVLAGLQRNRRNMHARLATIARAILHFALGCTFIFEPPPPRADFFSFRFRLQLGCWWCWGAADFTKNIFFSPQLHLQQIGGFLCQIAMRRDGSKPDSNFSRFCKKSEPRLLARLLLHPTLIILLRFNLGVDFFAVSWSFFFGPGGSNLVPDLCADVAIGATRRPLQNWPP